MSDTKESEFWNHPYYKMVKIVTTAMGQWPYQSTGQHILHAAVIVSILSTMLTIQLSALWTHRNDFDTILDCSVPLIADILLLIKYINNCCHWKTMVRLLEQIKYNWRIFPKNNGLHVLHDYSAFGKKFAKLYMTGIWVSFASYVTEPLQERFTVYLLYPNVTLPKRFSMPFEFGPIDVDTWYYYLWFGTTCGIFTRLTTIGACDLLLFTLSEHANGFLKALGYATENLPPYDESSSEDESFNYLRRCVIIHDRAINFAESVRDVYMWSFFGIIGMNMLIMSVTGIQIVNSLDNSKKLIKFSVNMLTQMLHLFVECFVGQRVMDASFDLKETITNAKWYNASKKTQKMIPLMLLRAQKPVVLTAGKVFFMCMSTYAVVLKTAMSYFTVFLAVR